MRLMRVAKEAGRNPPAFSDDEVVDYLVTEAVMIAARTDENTIREEAEKKAKREKWKKGHKTLAADVEAGTIQ